MVTASKTPLPSMQTKKCRVVSGLALVTCRLDLLCLLTHISRFDRYLFGVFAVLVRQKATVRQPTRKASTVQYHLMQSLRELCDYLQSPLPEELERGDTARSKYCLITCHMAAETLKKTNKRKKENKKNNHEFYILLHGSRQCNC